MITQQDRNAAPALDPDRFAVFGHWRRIWAVASINGRRKGLVALHDMLADRFRFGDRLVYLGNYLGDGEDPSGTLDELIAFRRSILAMRGMAPGDIVFLRGSQEEMWHRLQQLHLAVDASGVLAWMLDHGVSGAIESYGHSAEQGMQAAGRGTQALMTWTSRLRDAMHRRPGHDTLMSQLKRACVTANGTLLFVHAGLDPGRPLEIQSDAFWWNPGGFHALSKPYGNIRYVVRGFDPDQRGIDIGDYRASLDGGTQRNLVAGCFDREARLVDRIIV